LTKEETKKLGLPWKKENSGKIFMFSSLVGKKQALERFGLKFQRN